MHQYMSKCGNDYRIHNSLQEARQFEQEHNPDHYTHWVRNETAPWYEPKIISMKRILIKCIIILAAFTLPIAATLLILKFS